MTSVFDRIKALEARRAERGTKLLRGLDPVVRAARAMSLVARAAKLAQMDCVPTSAGDRRAQRVAELCALAQSRASAAQFSDLA